MNKLLITLLLLCGLGLSFAQTGVKEEVDPKAKAILDELSSKTKACNSIKSDFTIENLGSDKKVKDSNAGSITLKGLKYVLNVKGQKIICDGKSQWTVISESKEVQVNNAPDPKSTDQVNPTNIFTLYEKGYKYKFEKEEVIAGTLNQVINLYPLDPAKKPYHTVKIYVDKTKKQMTALKILNKDASITQINIKSFSCYTETNEGMFSLKMSDYPGYELIDLKEN